MSPKVSVIVPVYNAGEYLKLCLDSLKHQTLQDIEFILVLDCPTDGSDKIAEEYAQNDARFKLIYNSENLHTGFSRNEGIQCAKGEYVGFADHDDYCELEMFEQLYKLAKEESADVVISNFYDENNGSQSFFAFPKGFNNRDFQKNAFDALISGRYSKKNTYSFDNMNVIWNQIYRRSFLIENHILFLDNRKLTMEDVFFSIQVYHFATKVCYLPETYYHHVNTDSNNYNNYSYRSISKILPFIERSTMFLKSNNIWEDYKNQFAICTLKRLYASFRNELKFKGVLSLCKFFKQVRSNTIIQDILNVFSKNKKLLKQFALTKIIFLFIIRKSSVS